MTLSWGIVYRFSTKEKLKTIILDQKLAIEEVLTQFNNTSKYNLSGHDWLYDVHNNNKTDKKKTKHDPNGIRKKYVKFNLLFPL